MSIFDKKAVSQTHAPVRTADTIAAQLEDIRGRIADLTSQRDSISVEVAALVVGRNPSTTYRAEKLNEELTSLAFGIVEEGRLEKALSFELAQIQLPAARAEADRLAAIAEAALAVLAQAIQAAASIVMAKAATAFAVMATANVAHASAERLAGETGSSFPRFSFDRQTLALLRPAYAYGAPGAEWNERMGRAIPLGNLFLHGL